MMAVKEISKEQLTDEQKDARGKVWVTDNGVTYWYESVDDVLAWMEEHDPNDFAAIAWRMGRKSTNEH